MNDQQKNDDIEVMLAFKSGDEKSFEKLLGRYEAAIINFAYRYAGNRADAENIAQEVFLRVYRSSEKYIPTAKFSTWLYTIAANLCLDHKRKMSRDTLGHADPIIETGPGEDERESHIPDTSEKPIELSLEQLYIDEKVQLALLSLTENQRLALTLKVYEDKPYTEIAQILGCSVPSVESLLFRARQTLKQKLVHLR